jgi:hypothetical protein
MSYFRNWGKSTLRNFTSLQLVKISALRKSPPATWSSVVSYPRDYHGNPRALLRRILNNSWVAYLNNHLLKAYPFAKIVPNKLTKKQCLLKFFLQIWDCISFVQFYLIPTEILSVINSRESGFARMLQSDAVIWFQRYNQRSNLKRGWYRRPVRLLHVVSTFEVFPNFTSGKGTFSKCTVHWNMVDLSLSRKNYFS